MSGFPMIFRFLIISLVIIFGQTGAVISDNYNETLRALFPPGSSERLVGTYTWTPINRLLDLNVSTFRSETCSPESLANLSEGVVRIHNPVRPSCDFGRPVSQQAQLSVPYDHNGCTGWRIADTLFVTAWHCMSEDEFSCQNTTIGFGYSPDLADISAIQAGDFSILSSDWNQRGAERCEEIVYQNRVLDIVFFRVSTDHYEDWGAGQILEILPGTQSFPTQADRLAVLQHPAPGIGSCRSAILERIGDVYDRYQMELQASVWGRTRDPYCQLQRREEGGSIRWYTGTNPYPDDACSFDDFSGLAGTSGPNNAILHGCDTCPMSSGAPIISLGSTGGIASENRACTVIGMHLRAGNGRQHDGLWNVGLRMSVLGECVDFASTRQHDNLVLQFDNGTLRPECRADIPADANFLDCRDRGVERYGSVCEGYVLR